jgi:DNA ligase-1
MNYYPFIITSNLVTDLTNTTKRNEKIKILNKYKNEKVVQDFLYFVYNPFITTGISKAKFNRALELTNDVDEFDSLDAFTDYLKIHNTGTDEDLIKVGNFVTTYPEYTDLLRKYVTKDFQLGVDTKTLNTVFGKGFIPTFDVQLANSYQKRKDKIIGKEINITTKIDGVRCFVVKNGDDIHFYNRSGIEIIELNDLYSAISPLKGYSFCLDGELYASGDFKESKDGYKATIERSRIKGIKTGLKLRVFDYLSLDDYKTQSSTTPYYARRKMLEEIVNKINSLYAEALPSLYTGIASDEVIDKIAHEQIENGEEGIMINDTNAFYEFKRSDALLKYKLFEDYDLEVIGFEEGDGRNKGVLGALLVKYKDFVVKVGSGFSDELRKEIWNNRETWLGRTVIVKAFETTSNQQGGESLRFPVYIDWRDDK